MGNMFTSWWSCVRWENNISEWTGLKFCVALREAENKIKWRERVLGPWRPNGDHDNGIGEGATKAKFALDRMSFASPRKSGPI